MNHPRRNWLTFSTVAGSLTIATALLIRRGRVQRAALAGRIEEVTQQALQQLGVAAESRYITVNGLQLHTVMAGPRDGKLIVLLHGFPEHWYAWRKQIAPLVNAGYRVVVPDQRGYNLSDKPIGVHHYRLDALAADVRELIRTFERDTAIVVGHDWGGSVAWQFAMEYPKALEKLIVLNAPHPAAFARELRENPAQQQRSWYMLFFQLPWLPEFLLGQSPLATANLFFRLGAMNQNAFSTYDLDVMAIAMAQPGALTGGLNYYRAAFRYRTGSVSRPIETPTLLIWGEDDVALGKSLTYNLDRWVTHLKLHYIFNCGHWVQNEAPDEVNAQLLAFLST